MSNYGLCIETSDDYCTLALSLNGSLHLEEISTTLRSHASEITLLIDKLVKKAEITYSQLKFIAVSKGPGSYTGLRIGTSTAKGLCYALDIPLISIDTFEILYQEAKENHYTSEYNHVVAMIDARRMEVYMMIWDKNGQKLSEPRAIILDENSVSEKFKEGTVFIGSGAFKMEGFKNSFLFKTHDVRPKARFMLNLAENKFDQNQFENLAYYEPFYLKEFYVTKSKNQLKK